MTEQPGTKQLHARVSRSEHDAVSLLAEMVGASMSTCIAALASEGCRRFAEEPEAVASLIHGYRLGTPRGDK